MARTDRLMRLMDSLRRLPGPATAARLAAETGVSQRQLYRDIATLRAGGALIDGEAGLGYRLTEDPALPPQSFSRLEIEALLMAVAQLRQLGDLELTDAAETAMARIVATLPERQAMQASHAVLRSFGPVADRPQVAIDLGALRSACWEEEEVEIDYTDLKQARTRRCVWPLGISYSEFSMLLLAWCGLRRDFRLFHVTRIASMRLTGRSFRPRRASLIRDYVARRECEAEGG